MKIIVFSHISYSLDHVIVSPNSSCYLTPQTMFASKCDGITWEGVKVVSEEGRNWYSCDLIGNICAPIQMDRNIAKLMFQSCVTNMNRSLYARSWENSRKIQWIVMKRICIKWVNFCPLLFQWSKIKSKRVYVGQIYGAVLIGETCIANLPQPVR